MNDLDKDQFIKDVFQTIGSMGIWPSFCARMEHEFDYTQEQVEEMFDEIMEDR